MFIEELKQLLKENLRIDISRERFSENTFHVSILFDGELVTSDYFTVQRPPSEDS